jgi:hypothetical protein
VSDTGTGMTDHVKAHLFEPFFTTKPKGRGTGLGLATCQTIVSQSQGHIDVSSRLGKGTTFKCISRAPNDRTNAMTPTINTGTLPRGTEALLVVEDEPALRHLACAVLQAHGYDVLSATNGQDGLRVAREHKGAAIPPGGHRCHHAPHGRQDDGRLAAIEQSRSQGSCSHQDTPTDALGPHGMLDPGIAFLPKPYTPATLTRRVRELLDSH